MSTSETLWPEGVSIVQEPGTTHSVRPESQASESVPDVRGPYDVWHSEAYLIGWLVRLHGWYVLEPGTLRRRWRPDAALRAQAERLARQPERLANQAGATGEACEAEAA